MVPFQVLFEDKDQIEFEGKTIQRAIRLKEPGDYTLIFIFLECNSPFTQAIVLFFNDFVGEHCIMGQKRKLPQKRFPQERLWADCLPQEFEVTIRLIEGYVSICNGSDLLGDKCICRTLYMGCAMHVEPITEHRFICYCNDHEVDADFDDLIFEVEIRKTNIN